jgi:hypothetical protein
VLGGEYGSTRLGEVDMLRELVLAIGIPLLVLLLAVLALEQWHVQLPDLAAAIGRTPVLALERRYRADHRPVVDPLVAATLRAWLLARIGQGRGVAVAVLLGRRHCG